jgi:hypothetical protein
MSSETWMNGAPAARRRAVGDDLLDAAPVDLAHRVDRQAELGDELALAGAGPAGPSGELRDLPVELRPLGGGCGREPAGQGQVARRHRAGQALRAGRAPVAHGDVHQVVADADVGGDGLAELVERDAALRRDRRENRSARYEVALRRHRAVAGVERRIRRGDVQEVRTRAVDLRPGRGDRERRHEGRDHDRGAHQGYHEAVRPRPRLGWRMPAILGRVGPGEWTRAHLLGAHAPQARACPVAPQSAAERRGGAIERPPDRRGGARRRRSKAATGAVICPQYGPIRVAIREQSSARQHRRPEERGGACRSVSERTTNHLAH